MKYISLADSTKQSWWVIYQVWQYKTRKESKLKFVETSNRYSLLTHIVFFYMIWAFSEIVLFPWMKVLKLYGSWIFLNKFKNVSFVDFYVDIRKSCNAWSMELFVFCKKCTAIDTKRSGEMADVWQIGEIRWNKQNLLYRKIFIRRLNG